jgi:hypothetical protein
VLREESGKIPGGATIHQGFTAKRGDHIRATVRVQPGPVDAQLFVDDADGKQKVLAEQKGVKEATLEADVPIDGANFLSIHSDAKDEMPYTFKIERR